MATELLVSAGVRGLQTRSRAAAPVVDPTAGVRRRIELGGLLIDQLKLVDAGERIGEFLRSGRPHRVVTVNLDFISIARRDATFRSTINTADLAVADGMPLVWASRLKGQPLPERVAGVDLVAESCRVLAAMGGSVFLFGAGPGVAHQAGRRLAALYPGLRVVGAYSPPVGRMNRKHNERALRQIRKAAPQLLLVALGAPRQDVWIREFQAELQVPVAIGVGCVFDLLVGSVRRAPAWMQRTGLEWAWRLGQEPQRLWRRYLLDDMPVLARLMFQGPVEISEALVATP